MLNERTLLKLPYHCKLYTVYPPSINEVVETEKFAIYKKLLTTSQEDIEDYFVEQREHGDLNAVLANPTTEEIIPTPFENLLIQAYNSEELKQYIQEAFLFFIHESVTFLFDQQLILIGDMNQMLRGAKSLKDLRFLSANNFLEFQNDIRMYGLGEKTLEPPNPNEPKKLRQMRAKMRLRDKIKAKKGGGLDLAASILSICCMNLGLSLLTIGEISYAAVPHLINYYQEKTKYETDIQSILHGADSKKVNPVSWIRNIDN